MIMWEDAARASLPVVVVSRAEPVETPSDVAAEA